MAKQSRRQPRQAVLRVVSTMADAVKVTSVPRSNVVPDKKFDRRRQ
jgi:hypothetical protein